MKNLIKLVTLTFFAVMPAIAFAKYTMEPVKIYIKPEEKLSSLTFRNENDQDAKFQAEVMKWTQVDGKDVYEPSKDLIVTPKSFSLKAKGSQLIRVAPQAGTRKQDEEVLYRIFFKELPKADMPKEGVNMLFSFGIPVFLEPQNNKAGELVCSIMEKKDIELECKNNHNEHVFISELMIKDKKETLETHKMHKYLFAGSSFTQSFEKVKDVTHDSNGVIVAYFKGNRFELKANIKDN